MNIQLLQRQAAHPYEPTPPSSASSTQSWRQEHFLPSIYLLLEIRRELLIFLAFLLITGNLTKTQSVNKMIIKVTRFSSDS